MTSKKIVVVGSGIAGIVAAYFESKKNNQVTLIDSASEAGGLLKSSFNGREYFDYGTHILSEPPIPELADFLFSDFNENNCVIDKTIMNANYYQGKMNNKSCYVDTSVIDKKHYHQGCIDLLQSNDEQEHNLEIYFKSKFGNTFYRLIYEDVIKKYMGVNPALLASKVGYFFDMSRLLAFDDLTTKRLTQLDIYYSKLGHHIKEEGIVKYYPKQGGVGKLIEFLMLKLRKQGVVFKPSTKITAVTEVKGKVNTIVTDQEKITVDKLIWSLPSALLMKLINYDVIASSPIFRNTGLYDFTFLKPLKSEATFINVYDIRLLSGRVTLYQNLARNNNYSCTVEVLADGNIQLDNLTDVILQELIVMGLVEESNACLFKKFRPIINGFPVLTTDFVLQQAKLNGTCENYFKNVLLIGRASGRAFFMKEVLVDAYKRVQSD